MTISARLQHWATLYRTPLRHAQSGHPAPPVLPVRPRERAFSLPLHERIGLVVLDAVIMAVCVGGLAFTGFIGYMALR